MMRKKSSILKEYKLAIAIALLVIVLGSIGIVVYLKLNNNKIKEFNNEYYTFNYNSSWKVKEENEKSILLMHGKNANINIEIVTLEDEYRYLSIEDLLDEFLYNVESQNKDYSLIFKESAYITKNNYEGYKMLYENGENQAMVAICKKEDCVIIFKYESTNNYFDILLDSAQNIIYTFNTIDKQFELSYKLNVDTKDIKWNSNEEITSSLEDIEEYEIADKNYLVNFSIPLNFELRKLDSTYGYFNYKGLTSGSIILYADIENRNIYEYIEKNGNLYKNYNNIRNGEEYSNFKEAIKKMDLENGIGYIYKNSYTYAGYSGNQEYEEVLLIYELDTNHIFIIELEASKVSIPEELVSRIKMNSSKNYSSYINNKKENGNLICELKEFIDYEKTKIQVITLKVPERYKEIDKGYYNIYTHRNFGLNYNEEMEIYEYDVEYETSLSIESKLDILNSRYSSYKNKGEYKELEYKETREVNGKIFDIYEGGYTDIGGALFFETGRKPYYVNSKVLFYKLNTGNVLSIEIKGNGVEISNEVLNELTNFNIETKTNEKRGNENEL